MATEDQKSKVNAAIEDLKKALEGKDSEAIKAKTEALQEAVYPISTAMYQKAQEQAQQAAAEQEALTQKVLMRQSLTPIMR